MSKLLADILGEAKPQFRLQLAELENAAGRPGHDIRLAMEIVAETKKKVRELGLDPADTTGAELYSSLKARLLDDEKRVRGALGLAENDTLTDLLGLVQWHVSQHHTGIKTFAIKQTPLRALLKKLNPKNTAKLLGYRSVDSLLKHESLAHVLAAASVAESAAWHARRLAAYGRLNPGNFESRAVSISVPRGRNWADVNAVLAEQYKHDLVSVPELGAVVLLPPAHDIPGLVITTVLLTVRAVNDMRSFSSWLKLQQFGKDFGKQFVDGLQHEPLAVDDVAGTPLPWKTLHKAIGQGSAAYQPELFEPHVQEADFAWLLGEDTLVRLHPTLEFWQGTQLLAWLDGTLPVSLNVLDVALGVANNLDYGERMVHHLRDALGHELLSRYLHAGNIQSLLAEKLTPEFALD